MKTILSLYLKFCPNLVIGPNKFVSLQHKRRV
jgi:hypothetical protein